MAGGDQRPEAVDPDAVEPDPWDRLGDGLSAMAERISALEQRQEELETMCASLMGGMGQQWAALEALISFTLEGKSDEEREKWQAAFAWFTNELWRAVKDSAMAGATPASA